MFTVVKAKRGWDEHLFSGNLGSVNLHFAAASVWHVGVCRLRAVPPQSVRGAPSADTTLARVPLHCSGYSPWS